MVMQKVRASSYLRRTISEPFPKGRFTTGMSQIPETMPTGFVQSLLPSGSIPPITENESLQYTWKTDALGLWSLLATHLNIMLIFSPLGILAAQNNWGDLWVFWFNFFALIPEAAILGNSTEQLALHTGDTIGGLLNATFGNAVEMILTVQSLRAGLIPVVQGTLLGSILSNLLLVLGMSFLCGGLFHQVQKFNAQGAACSTSLLMLASLAFITPTIAQADNANTADVLEISRITAVFIGLTYFLYLFFQLYTHINLFKDEQADELGDECEDWASLSFSTACFALLAITLLIAYQSECLVQSIEGVSVNSGIPETFIGVILLPIVGNAAEHATAVTVAIKNKPDLTMGVAVGSSTQIAMFMVPFAVIVGWMMNVPMTLAFSLVSVVVLVFSILIVIGVVQDGESNWLEGVMLIVAYCIIAVVFWFDTTTSVSNKTQLML
eukprot:Protomagalhaensia_sp_Gyna_25__1152@NODE_1566_length_1727_cov_36_385664_g1273_i0_p1_GENE_NODE_1566_length_1727_cov_36_385664_g1273_i0NODE_1566_length_1727_cov_36_385664_g1273_i0_p1_ORF_typecomplete_len439_score49_09Na_Ca_ex/PF01699_24/6_4e27Na_Ca_ex/PF01699_24/1_3e22SLATT_6/PF18169_1/0_12SLATT_6/PF18169_1/2e03SelK_SelG/PF10961_8/0_56_NODE_1566_length_1727_cov_36_385664_g1273_i03291645